MRLLSTAKRLSIAVGLYRPARWLASRLRPKYRRSHTETVEFYRSLLPSGSLCFDVGANIGEKSAAMLYAGARVVAFEPNPQVLPELRARCGYHRDWTVVEAALGSAAAIAPLFVRHAHQRSSLLEDWDGDICGVHYVPVVTLDSAIHAFGLPYYCKIDVEGWEVEVLHGLSRRLPLVSFEFHLDDVNNPKTIAVLRRLAELGPSLLNFTAAESSAFRLSRWIDVEHFLDNFPANLKATMTKPWYGDIYVKSEPDLGP